MSKEPTLAEQKEAYWHRSSTEVDGKAVIEETSPLPPDFHGVHIIGGQMWYLNEELRCRAPGCPVCRAYNIPSGLT